MPGSCLTRFAKNKSHLCIIKWFHGCYFNLWSLNRLTINQFCHNKLFVAICMVAIWVVKICVFTIWVVAITERHCISLNHRDHATSETKQLLHSHHFPALLLRPRLEGAPPDIGHVDPRRRVLRHGQCGVRPGRHRLELLDGVQEFLHGRFDNLWWEDAYATYAT